MIYAAIDTNVLVSALLNFQSNPGQVLLSVFNGETIPLVNEEILAEYRDVLARKKFRFPPDLVDIVLSRLAVCSLNISAISEVFPEVAALLLCRDHVGEAIRKCPACYGKYTPFPGKTVCCDSGKVR